MRRRKKEKEEKRKNEEREGRGGLVDRLRDFFFVFDAC